MEEIMSTLNTSMASMQNTMAMKDKQQIAAMKAKKLSLKKRKACIKKKTMELSVLCGIEAGVLIVDDNGEVETWPENQSAMMKIIARYKNRVHNTAGDNLNEYSYDQGLLQNDCSNVFDGDQYQKKKKNNMVLNRHSLDDHLFPGFQLELQEVLRSVNAKLEAVASRIEFLNMVVDDDDDGGGGKNDKKIVVYGEVPKLQNIIQTTSMSFPSSMCLSGGGNLNQQIIESPNFGWSGYGYGSSLISLNNVLGSSDVDLSVNNHQIIPSFGGHFEQGFLNGKQTMQTPYCFEQESDEFLLNMVPGMHPPPEFTTGGLYPEPEQSTFGIWQNSTGFLDYANQFSIHQLQQSNHSFHQF